MKSNWLRTLATRPALRISLAVLLIVIGIAPVGQPILSDSSWRASAAPAAQATPEPEVFVYRSSAQGDTLTPSPIRPLAQFANSPTQSPTPRSFIPSLVIGLLQLIS